jgi:hypothetical protein
MRSAALLILTLGGLLVFAAGGAWVVWHHMGDVEMTRDGFLALGLGVGFSLLLGIGLMRLVYVSHKRGYDDILPPGAE